MSEVFDADTTAAREGAPLDRAGREELLRTLFAQVLGVKEVDAGQSFIALGGDSILAIQLVSRARQAGLVVSTREVLRLDNVRALAGATRVRERVEAQARMERHGALRPTPIMHWLRELGGPLDTYNQSLVLRTPPGLDTAALVRVLQQLLDTHDALRMRLPDGPDAEEWRPEIPPPGRTSATLLTERVDATGLDDAAALALTQERMRQARRRLSTTRGEMVRAVWLDRGPRHQGRLALVAHHLVVDGVSLRVLQEDLRACWEQLAKGGEPQPEAEQTSFLHWSRVLHAEATRGRRMAELDRWRQTLVPDPAPLAGLHPADGRAPMRAECTLTRTLEADITGPLLTAAPSVVNGNVNDVLLAGLALSIVAWRQQQVREDRGVVLVEVEGHGREEIVDGLDLSRTVGWFTSVFPVRFTLGAVDVEDARAGGPTVGAALREVKEQLRAVPDKGLGYGLLRHLNSRTGPPLAAPGVPGVSFNYLGRFPMGQSEDWAAAPGHEFALDDADDGLPMPHAIELNCAAHEGPDGQLTLSATWTWAEDVYDGRQVGALADEWFAMLRAVVEHAKRPGVAGLTPSDVTLTAVSQADLDAIEAQLGEFL